MRNKIDYSEYIKENLNIVVEPTNFVNEVLKDNRETYEYIISTKKEYREEYQEYIKKEIEKHPYYLPHGRRCGIEYYWDYDDINDECIYWVPINKNIIRLYGNKEFTNWVRTRLIDDFLSTN